MKHPALTLYEKRVPKSATFLHNLAQVPLYPTPSSRNEKLAEFGTFKSCWTSDFKVPLYTPPHLPNIKLPDLELSSQVRLQISKCHFTPPLEMESWQIWNFQVKLDFRFQSATLPPPPLEIESKQIRFGTFKSSWTSDFKVPLYPPPHPSNEKLEDFFP